MRKINIVKLIFAIGFSGYFFLMAFDPSKWRFIYWIDLVIHEAGHLIFYPFGEYASIWGGTIIQLFTFFLFPFYFYYKRQYYSAGITLLLLGQSFLNVSVYIKDALTQQLPLLGGNIHDWNYLLSYSNLLDKSEEIGNAVWIVGILIILSGFVISVRNSKKEGGSAFSLH